MIFPFKPPCIGDFPLPRLITGGIWYKTKYSHQMLGSIPNHCYIPIKSNIPTIIHVYIIICIYIYSYKLYDVIGQNRSTETSQYLVVVVVHPQLNFCFRSRSPHIQFSYQSQKISWNIISPKASFLLGSHFFSSSPSSPSSPSFMSQR